MSSPARSSLLTEFNITSNSLFSSPNNMQKYVQKRLQTWYNNNCLTKISLDAVSPSTFKLPRKLNDGRIAELDGQRVRKLLPVDYSAMIGLHRKGANRAEGANRSQGANNLTARLIDVHSVSAGSRAGRESRGRQHRISCHGREIIIQTGICWTACFGEIWATFRRALPGWGHPFQAGWAQKGMIRL